MKQCFCTECLDMVKVLNVSSTNEWGDYQLSKHLFNLAFLADPLKANTIQQLQISNRKNMVVSLKVCLCTPPPY